MNNILIGIIIIVIFISSIFIIQYNIRNVNYVLFENNEPYVIYMNYISDEIDIRKRIFIGYINDKIIKKVNPNNIFLKIDKNNFTDWKIMMIKNKIIKNTNIQFLNYGYYKKHLDNTIIEIIVMNDDIYKKQVDFLINDLEYIYNMKRFVYIICNYPYKNYFWDKKGLSLDIKYKSIIRGIFSFSNINNYYKIDNWKDNNNIGNVWNIPINKNIKCSLPLNTSLEIIDINIQ